ncbi:hypothetical protein VF14_18245 [Nostoc linckia z18]|uniref:Uncharacterized protein n=2 Tax=Nostoc linckia TaxID=92942 RepID=A0A9Q5Z571_NOSLI|nr:hypothetical protein [Nostoc linckia]PHJ80057.1 hypothetical protein VF04_38055 [Nostoc linckia z7]PHJ81985.1 hypothetical protein VF07_29285 [Nostoc linckia z6]PHJ94022.1 hypothetical protein VF08_34395 [Nostoc linckia z8]PHK05052.1 hypothetical protein VF10_38010 [Nostoc linckia z13]PHK09329.1 hypothetical protein VF09_16060 [Nostoc linckia z9]
MKKPKYPDITVKLSGTDGNAFSIIGNCCRAARKAGLSKQEIQAFMDDASKSDYHNVIRVAMRWFNCQ